MTTPPRSRVSSDEYQPESFGPSARGWWVLGLTALYGGTVADNGVTVFVLTCIGIVTLVGAGLARTAWTRNPVLTTTQLLLWGMLFGFRLFGESALTIVWFAPVAYFSAFIFIVTPILPRSNRHR